ncbi:MAG: coenzyme F420 hydrogenase, partial [Lachnospiraceae bacterium]|nr:coenzyme F420 hydrogenase [Lachnospiraceae bacterium]
MEENDRGFLMPQLDSTKCIECGLCIKTCAELNPPEKYGIISSYVAVAKDRKILMNSTSGGVFGVIAKYILYNCGVVYGCAWDEDLT